MNLASRTQVSGHFFLRRRLGFALLRRSVRMEVDPVRWQRVLLMLSAVVAAILVIGGFVVGFFRPAGQITDSTKIVAERKTGTLYAVVDGRLHPALNLVSAQLIAGSPDAPTFVNADEIAKWPKGPTVGIMGAPIISANTVMASAIRVMGRRQPAPVTRRIAETRVPAWLNPMKKTKLMMYIPQEK